MKMGADGNLIPENYDERFDYGGTYFVCDKHKYGWQVSERNHDVSKFSPSLRVAKYEAMIAWKRFKERENV